MAKRNKLTTVKIRDDYEQLGYQPQGPEDLGPHQGLKPPTGGPAIQPPTSQTPAEPPQSPPPKK